MVGQDLTSQILRLKKEKGVTILAHFYQTLDIQRVADFVGDSLALAKQAKSNIKTPYILFAGVRFMAETASILNQSKVVLMPELDAGCPMADQLTPAIINQFKRKYPKSPVIVYVNTTAAVKAVADVCCTSSNALKVTQAVAKEWHTDTILFGPDQNLGNYIITQTNLKLIIMPPDGNCPIHHHFTIKDVEQGKKAHPNAKILVHPESPSIVVKKADYTGSTSDIGDYVKLHPELNEFIIGTENAMVHYLADKFPQQKFYPLEDHAFCSDMKKTTLKKIYNVLNAIGTDQEHQFEIKVSPDIASQAIKSIEKMMQYS